VYETDTRCLQNEIDALRRQIEEQLTIVRECQVHSHGLLLLEAMDNLRVLRRRLDKLTAQTGAGPDASDAKLTR
jgi:hypothetical protein